MDMHLIALASVITLVSLFMSVIGYSVNSERGRNAVENR
jgi:hypothetical protein